MALYTLDGLAVTNVVSRVLTAGVINAHNTFEQPNQVQPNAFDGVTIRDTEIEFLLPAKSVVALALTGSL